MTIMYDIYYKSPTDGFNVVCDKLKAEGKKPWFHHVKIKS